MSRDFGAESGILRCGFRGSITAKGYTPHRSALRRCRSGPKVSLSLGRMLRFAVSELITHGESGRSGVGRTRNVIAPTSLAGQFEQPYGPMGPPTLFTIPVLRYMKTYGLTHEQLAMVSVVQREWPAKNPRATFKTPITVEDVLNSRMIAYPFRLLQCCLVTDGGGALILVSAERARDFPQKPVYLLGTGESVETPMVSQMEDFTSSRAFRV